MDFFCQLLTPAAGPLAAARRCDIRQFDASVVPEQQLGVAAAKVTKRMIVLLQLCVIVCCEIVLGSKPTLHERLFLRQRISISKAFVTHKSSIIPQYQHTS
jgi:hypothetical protein